MINNLTYNFHYKSILTIVLIFIGSIFVTYLIFDFGNQFGFFLIAFLFGILITALCFFKPFFGLFFIIILDTSSVSIQRIVYWDQIPTGILSEILMLVTFAGTLFSLINSIKYSKVNSNTKPFISILIWIPFTYGLLQYFNTNATSIDAYLYSLRGLILTIITFYSFKILLSNKRKLILFSIFWLILAFAAALYALKQEYFGFTSWEIKSMLMSTGGRKLPYIGGRINVFSFLNDPKAFGIFMAYSSLFTIVFAISQRKNSNKYLLLLFSVLMLMALAFSGSRTAYAMIPAGFSLFSLLLIRNKNALIISMLMIIALLFILFGPIKFGIIKRMQTTLELEEDPSYQIRKNKILYFQDYIKENPLGGGVFSTGSIAKRFKPVHPFAGFGPDSGYLRTAIEKGWLGFMINIIFHILVISYAISCFYDIRDNKLKLLIASYIICYFALSVSNYSQDVYGDRPILYIQIASLAILENIRKYDIKHVQKKT